MTNFYTRVGVNGREFKQLRRGYKIKNFDEFCVYKRNEKEWYIINLETGYSCSKSYHLTKKDAIGDFLGSCEMIQRLIEEIKKRPKYIPLEKLEIIEQEENENNE